MPNSHNHFVSLRISSHSRVILIFGWDSIDPYLVSLQYQQLLQQAQPQDRNPNHTSYKENSIMKMLFSSLNTAIFHLFQSWNGRLQMWCIKAVENAPLALWNQGTVIKNLYLGKQFWHKILWLSQKFWANMKSELLKNITQFSPLLRIFKWNACWKCSFCLMKLSYSYRKTLSRCIILAQIWLLQYFSANIKSGYL